MSVAYVASLVGFAEVTGADDADLAVWVPLDEALDSELAFDHDVILRDAALRAELPVNT